MTERRQPRRNLSTRSEMRRHQVLEAAADCFCHNGFRGTSMSEISGCAGMSTGHIYYYFKSKEAIVEAIVERYLQNDLALIERVRTPREILSMIITGMDDTLATDPTLVLEIKAESLRNKTLAEVIKAKTATASGRLTARLVDFQEQGLINPSVDTHSLCSVLLAIFDGFAIRRATMPAPGSDAGERHQQELVELLSPILG